MAVESRKMSPRTIRDLRIWSYGLLTAFMHDGYQRHSSAGIWIKIDKFGRHNLLALAAIKQNCGSTSARKLQPVSIRFRQTQALSIPRKYQSRRLNKDSPWGPCYVVASRSLLATYRSIRFHFRRQKLGDLWFLLY